MNMSTIYHYNSNHQIGKRVYWPGSGLDVVEYDLLGTYSRTILYCTVLCCIVLMTTSADI